MSASLTHFEINAGHTYKRSVHRVPLEPHQLFDARRSKTNNARSFRRYLATVRGLHQASHGSSYAAVEHSGAACLVCARTDGPMHNAFHRKCGTMLRLDDARAQDTQGQQGFFVEVDCDYNVQQLPMCATCLAQQTESCEPGRPHDLGPAEAVLRRCWRQQAFPLVRSIMRGPE